MVALRLTWGRGSCEPCKEERELHTDGIEECGMALRQHEEGGAVLVRTRVRPVWWEFLFGDSGKWDRQLFVIRAVPRHGP